MALGKALILPALLCTLSSAQSCDGFSDETSLLQVEQKVQPGSDRIPYSDYDPTGVTHWKAIADSTPDHLDDGKVVGAFEINSNKASSSIEKKTADQIDFANTQREERKVSRDKARETVQSLQEKVASSIKADRKAVVQAAEARRGVMKAAVDRVKAAKTEQEAHRIKKIQAEKAAVLGRAVGMSAGKQAAHKAWVDYKEAQFNDATDRRVALAKRRRRIAERLARARVDKMTAAKARRANVMTHNADRQAKGFIAGAAAKAAMTEAAIEGPEGLKNSMTDEAAKVEADRYKYASRQMEDNINAYAHGELPMSDWPAGP